MRPWLLNILQCPISRSFDLGIYSLDPDIGFVSVSDHHARADIQIRTGLVLSRSRGIAFPIISGIPSILPIEDAPEDKWSGFFDEIESSTPQQVRLCIETTRALLMARQASSSGTWEREEMEYYDKKNKIDLEDFMRQGRKRADLSRIIPRTREMISLISRTKPGLVLEIGCGSAKNMFYMLNPQRVEYSYVGLDISMGRLVEATKIMPGGDFVQASAMHPPFKPQAFDAVIAFGAFHHMPDPNEAVLTAAGLARIGGFLAFHEPMMTRKILPRSGSARRFVEKALAGYEHSDHDNEIDYKRIRMDLLSRKHDIVNEYYSSSIVGYAAAAIARAVPLLRSLEAVFGAIDFIDGLWCRSIGSLLSPIGPRSVMHVSVRH